MKVPFSPPDITEAEIKEVSEALRSGWITTGPRTKKLENEVREMTGAAGAACLNSATACEELALRLFEIGPGDEVIVPAYTYTSTASCVAHVGATIRMVDIEEDSYEINYDQLEAAINEHTKAVVPVDLGGVMCDYDRIREIVERKKSLFKPASRYQEALGRVLILSDAAHAFGAKRRLQEGWVHAGAAADFTSFSFHAVKNFTTAEGGALTWKEIPGISNEEIYKQLMLFSLHGQSKDALAKTQLGAWEYDIVGTWYKCNMTDVVAAIGLVQMERYPEMLKRRQELIRRYTEGIACDEVEVVTHFTEDNISSGHLMLVRIPSYSEEDRNTLIRKMAEADIATNVHYKPLPMHTAYKNLGFKIEDYPNAYARFACEITLPLHTLLTDEMQDYVIEQFNALR